MTTKSWRDFLPIHPAAELFPQRPLTIGDNHRMKRGEHVAKQPDTDPYTIETIAGTCLDRTDDHDELLKLNRGAEPGTLAAHKPKLAPNGKAAFYCSFSGKSQHDVAKLSASTTNAPTCASTSSGSGRPLRRIRR
jgi:hypothetical protein